MDERGPFEPPHGTWPDLQARARLLAGRAWRRVRGAGADLSRFVGERRWLRLSLIAAAAATAALAVAGGAAWQTCGFAGCPDAARLAAYRPDGAPLLLDRHGQVIATLSPDDGSQVRLASLPAHVAAAFVAIEDRRFFEHGAVDWRRAVGAFTANLRAHAIEQGFSTLSMQLARNVFPQEIPGRERTPSRKLIEIRVAQQLEARYSKPEILELYLNHIYFGNGARGIEAAAWQYFREPAARLTLAQAALLAALPKAPTRYDPRRHPDRALTRRNLVLACMAAQGRIASSSAAAARHEPLGVRPPPERPPGQPVVASYFVEEVRHQLEERFGASLYDQPVRVWTSLDLTAQRAAEEELEHQLQAIEAHGLRHAARAKADDDDGGDQRLEGAVVTLAAASGDVLAWVGGRDGDASRFDRVANARRQVGSAWKPFVYAAALARGVPLSQNIADTPLVVPLGGGASWEPRNYDGSFDGQVTLREALVRSKNVPTVRLSQAIGYGQIAELAASDGIPADGPLVPSMALGTVAASPLKLTAAYSAFANLGWRATPRLILRVDRADGTTLWTAPVPNRRQVLDPSVAYLLDDALRDAMLRGSGAPGLPPGLAGRAGGKTGTSTGGDDVWFVGFTSEVVTGVWIGFDEPRPIANQATGGRLAAPIFRRLMTRFYAGRPAPAWPAMPAGVETAAIDPVSGRVLSAGCVPAGGVPARQELFLAGHEPESACPGDVTADAALVTISPAAATVPAAYQQDDESSATRDAAGGEAPAGDAATAPTAPAAAVPRDGAAAASEQAGAGAGGGVIVSGGATGISASATNLAGWWTVVMTADGASGTARGARQTYLVALRQQGTEVTGSGECWEVDGRQLAAGSRNRIDVAGTIEGREVRLHFTERGSDQGNAGTLFFHLAPGGQDLAGTFTAGADNAHGVAAATRLR